MGTPGPQLTTLETTATTEDILEVVKRDGAAILGNVIPASVVEAMLSDKLIARRGNSRILLKDRLNRMHYQLIAIDIVTH